MADTSEGATRDVGVAKSTILRLIRPSAPASNPETAALRAECEGLRLALSLTQEALREERSDKEHWREEAKHIRQLLAATRPEPDTILQESENVLPEPTPEPKVIEAPALAPIAEADRLSAEMASAHSAEPAPRARWWGGYSPKF
jgi:hypothetical protein